MASHIPFPVLDEAGSNHQLFHFPQPAGPICHSIGGPEINITLTLAILSVVIFALNSFKATIAAKAPPWLRPFAKEEPPYELKELRWTNWTTALHLIAGCGFAVSIVSVFNICKSTGPHQVVHTLEVVPWTVAILITGLDRPIKTPKLLLCLYFCILFAYIGHYAAHFLSGVSRAMDFMELGSFAFSFLGVLCIGNMPLRDPTWNTFHIAEAGPGSTAIHYLKSPEDNLTLFQFWTMSWVWPLAAIAQRRELFEEDVWKLPSEFQHKRLYEAFRNLKGSLLPCLIEANGLDLLIATTLAVLEKVTEVSNIRLTSKLYSSLDSNDLENAVFWCFVMLGIDCIRQVTKTCAGWYSRKAYERSRGEAFIALFGKLLTRAVPGSEATEQAPEEEDENQENEEEPFIPKRGISGLFRSRRRKSRKDRPQTQSLASNASNAKVVNLVRGDSYEISQRFWEFSKLISQPIKVIFTIYYLISIMGWPSCVGFGLMFVFLSFNSKLVQRYIKLERERTAHSDRRAQAVAHFVDASRSLKLNAWTSFWSDKIMRFRESEMAKRLQISYVTSAISTVNVSGGAVYPLASICLFTVVLKDGLPNDVIWPSLQLFAHLEASVKEAFDLISAYWKATIPVERVNKYMSEPDRVVATAMPHQRGDIVFENASFSWPSVEKLVLTNVNLKLGVGLTVIRGPVGSGKSSLIRAALNEMQLRGGEAKLPREPVAYCQQLPWLQNKTIKDNIIFHQPYDMIRYLDTVRVCALSSDLYALEDRDKTKLEEGGIGLSGGQKARVALARAIYSQARILLLDDPLAALDHDTAEKIVERFMQSDLSRNRIIVIATHRDDLVVPYANQLVEIDEDGYCRVLDTGRVNKEKNKLRSLKFAEDEANEDSSSRPRTADSEAFVDDDDEDEQSPVSQAPEVVTEVGRIPVSIYTKYMKAGGWGLWATLAVFYGISRYCDVSRARLLEAWGEESTVRDNGYWGLPAPSPHPAPWIGVLSGLSAIQVLSYAVAQLLLAHISINAAKELFKVAVERVSKATFRYHDITPTGQLKNRLIADMGMVDGGILAPLESFVFNLIALCLSLIAIMTQQPLLILILAIVSILFVRFFIIYVPVSRALRRMEMRYLTPIIANIGVMQDGLITIRALRVEQHFQEKHLYAVDDFQKQDHFFWSMAFWLDFRLGMSTAAMRAMLIVFMIWYGTPASAVGFILTQTTIAMSAVQLLCEKFAALQLDAVSLERVEALNRIPEEPKGDGVPPDDWPRPSDSIKFENMSFRYAEGQKTIMNNVSFEIPGSTTCAVLGRTGSGKSTVANALLVTQTPFAGRVKIGDVDLARVDRSILRSRITFIQQDPTLFPGTLWENIDPEGKFPKEDSANVIKRVLGDEWNVNSQIDAGGKNLSQGERQLVGIARAVLRRSGLVILDEATASIDRFTAARVQRLLRTELAHSTVITIAHRLEAVEDANWCLRLDQGKVVECGPASNLGRRR